MPVCRHFGANPTGQTVFDPRGASNCPTTISFNSTTRQFSMRPIAAPVLPDVGGAGGSFWFQGIRSPQESQSYPSLQLLVPLVATTPVAGQPLSVPLCTVGTSCATASVDLTVGAAPAPADPPAVALPPGLQTTATGRRCRSA